MVATPESTPTAAPAIPTALIYEILNGKPLYYKGYREVIEKNLNPESIMGSSSLQAILVSLIYAFTINNRDKRKYLPVTNEAGLHLDLKDNLSCDVAIFEKGTFDISTNYFSVPPKIVIEVDVKIDLTNFDGMDFTYVAEKTERLFTFGVERVLWVLSATRKVVIMHPGQDWIVTDWSNDVRVMDGCVMNVKNLLDDEEIAD